MQDISQRANKLVKDVLEILNPDKIFPQLVKVENNSIFVINEGYKQEITGKKIHIIGVGKAASYEVRSFKNTLINLGQKNRLGLCLAYTKYKHTVLDEGILQLEGSHPEMSENNLMRTQEFLDSLVKLPREDTCLFLLSGGASALLVKPKKEISLEQKIEINHGLLHSGLNINDMNEIRKSLSEVKNGKTLKCIPCRQVIQFINCDIPNLDIRDVGSSPLVYKELNYEKINNYLSKHNTKLQTEVSQIRKITSIFSSGPHKLLDELVKLYGESTIKGELLDCTFEDALKYYSKEVSRIGEQIHLSGGEATINVTNFSGKGGRNTHFVLGLAHYLYKKPEFQDLNILSLGTDGTDGPTDAAGAFINFEMYQKLDPTIFLTEFNSYAYFEKVGGLIKTGPTGTNVMDIRFIWRN